MKYGPINMFQELLLITEDKEEALALEAEIVNADWVDDDSTYNLTLGGGVCILFSDNNGFYNKKHTKETIVRIQESRKKTLIETPFSWSESYLVSNPNIVFYNKKEIYEYFHISNWIEVGKLLCDDIIQYKSSHLQELAIKRYLRKTEYDSKKDERIDKKRKDVSERFKGIPKSKESNIKRGASISTWIKNNPEEHKSRMDKINKNPEKIQKSAESHRGQKRSDEARKNMSVAQKKYRDEHGANNKNKISIINLQTMNTKMISPEEIIPDGYVKGGKPKGKGGFWIRNTLTKEIRKSYGEIPDGWEKGR